MSNFSHGAADRPVDPTRSERSGSPGTRKEAADTADPYKAVSVRMRQAEFECFSVQARSLGLTNNVALRIAARRIVGFLETDEETRTLLQTITDRIGTIARDLNGINTACEQSGKADMDRLATLRASFGYEFAQPRTRTTGSRPKEYAMDEWRSYRRRIKPTPGPVEFPGGSAPYDPYELAPCGLLDPDEQYAAIKAALAELADIRPSGRRTGNGTG